jgi:hypothetical protein
MSNENYRNYNHIDFVDIFDGIWTIKTEKLMLFNIISNVIIVPFLTFCSIADGIIYDIKSKLKCQRK